MIYAAQQYEASAAPAMPAGPVANLPGAVMVELRACQAAGPGCPNSLIDAAAWQAEVQRWLESAEVSERLRGRLDGERIMAHDRLRIAIAGCPNACSQPQIADLAVVGRVRPSFDETACSGCGLCEAACPDRAIVVDETPIWYSGRCQGCYSCGAACDYDAVIVSRPWGQVLMGGKLGRRPQLAREAAEVHDPRELTAMFSRAVERFIDEAPRNMRFAAWWSAQREGGLL